MKNTNGLSGAFFAAALVYLVAGAAGLVVIAPRLASGSFLAPQVAGVTHLFTLGWITTSIFGALHQLLPVALGAPIRWERVARASWWTFVPGVALFAGGVMTSEHVVLRAGACLIATGICLVLVNVIWSLANAPRRDPTWAAIALAFAFLGGALTLGLVLAHNLETQFIGAARVRVLATHLHVATIGWVLMMIVGVSHRLLPMFLLSHGADTRWTARSLGLLAIGLPIWVVGVNAEMPVILWAGIVILLAGLGAFGAQARAFHRKRVRKRPEIALRFAATAMASLFLAALLGVSIAAGGSNARAIETSYVIAGVLGGFTLYVVGFSYKIIPLLVWTVAYRDQMGRSAVPMASEMYSQRVGGWQLALMASGVALLIASVLVASAAGARAATTLFLAGTIVFAAQLVRIALHLVHRNTVCLPTPTTHP